MCFGFDARPPELPEDLRVLAPLAGGAAAELTTVQSEDGTEVAVAIAPAPEPGGVGVIILPDVRGLYRFYVELAERFAAAGRHAIALDYFGRSAGAQSRDEDFDFMAHLPKTSPEVVQQDISAARDALRERSGADRFVTVGFCFGGAQSFLAATSSDLGIEAAIGFYGTLDPDRIGLPFAMPAPLRSVAETRRPVLGLFGGDDPLIPAEDIEAFDRALTQAGVEHEVVTYPGAPHSFFDRSFEEHAEASEDAWRRVLGFIERVSARTPA
jgi:carboxymethylenebutenolidase